MTLKMDLQGDTINLFLEGQLGDDNLAKFKKWADEVHQAVLDFHQKTGQKVKFLTDASKIESIGEKVMEVYSDLLKKDLPYVYRSATFGAKIDILIALTTLMVTSNRVNFQHFKTKEEAMTWLKE